MASYVTHVTIHRTYRRRSPARRWLVLFGLMVLAGLVAHGC